MGKRGPAPRTDGEKEYAGIALVPAEIGDCPDYVQGEARDEFHRLKGLAEDKLFVATDRALVLRYCSLWAHWIELERSANGQPPNDETRANPFWTTYIKIHNALQAAEDKLGLTPACRARLRADASEPAETQEQKEMFGE